MSTLASTRGPEAVHGLAPSVLRRQQLLQVLQLTRLTAGEVLDREGRLTARAGDGAAQDELDAEVRGPFCAPTGMLEYVDDDDLPTLFVQGRRVTYVVRVSENLTVVLQGEDDRELAQQSLAGRWIGHCVRAHFGGEPSAMPVLQPATLSESCGTSR